MGTPELFLQQLGLSSKEIQVYMTLLRRGPSSVRQLSDVSGVNRGTTHDILKSLQAQSLVSFYEKAKKAYFVAEDPSAIEQLLRDRHTLVESLEKQFSEVLPQMRSVADHADVSKPIARYYHGAKAIKTILEEVLREVQLMEKKEYLVYSSSSIAEHLYQAIPDFTKQRIAAGIQVKVISIGGNGETSDQYAERRSLSEEMTAPTYTIIYDHKTAFISLDDQGHPRGVIIQDRGLAQTQRLLFNQMWETLK